MKHTRQCAMTGSHTVCPMRVEYPDEIECGYANTLGIIRDLNSQDPMIQQLQLLVAQANTLTTNQAYVTPTKLNVTTSSPQSSLAMRRPSSEDDG